MISKDGALYELAHSEGMKEFEEWFKQELGYGGRITLEEDEFVAYREDGSEHSRWKKDKSDEVPYDKDTAMKIAEGGSRKLDEMIKEALEDD